ncbi:MAG TPA: nucleoside deaminase [Propionicimonas sp.]|jgi:tRNA(Arg) A34 adenosine deaminase TadA
MAALKVVWTIVIPTEFQVDIPLWVVTEVEAAGCLLPTLEHRMALVNRLADRNFRDGGGGPFAAIVVEHVSGRLISAGVNRVLASNLSVSHAEVVALSLAQRERGTWDLGASGAPETELVVNWRPCLQCCGAALWAGVSHIVIPDDSDLMERITGFDEGPVSGDWIGEFEARGIRVTKGIGVPEAVQVFRDYAAQVANGRAVLYNARGTGLNARAAT